MAIALLWHKERGMNKILISAAAIGVVITGIVFYLQQSKKFEKDTWKDGDESTTGENKNLAEMARPPQHAMG